MFCSQSGAQEKHVVVVESAGQERNKKKKCAGNGKYLFFYSVSGDSMRPAHNLATLFLWSLFVSLCLPVIAHEDASKKTIKGNA